MAANTENLLLSGSVDKSCKLFSLDSNFKYNFERELNYHEEYVYSVLPHDGANGFFTGGRDGRIFYIDNQGNFKEPCAVFEGHQGIVNSLSQSQPHELVSGSWDGTARIWDITTGKTKHVFQDH